MAKNFGSALSNEYEFILGVLNKHSGLSDRKIEFIKAFRAETSYGLLESKNIIEGYLGLSNINIWDYIKNSVDIPHSKRSDLKEVLPSPANPPVPQFYFVIDNHHVDYIGFVPSVIIGYLLGVFFTPYMFLDLRLTEWYNVFVYAWIFLWPLALICHLIIWFFASGAFLTVVAIIVLLFAIVLFASWWNDIGSHRLRR